MEGVKYLNVDKSKFYINTIRILILESLDICDTY